MTLPSFWFEEKEGKMTDLVNLDEVLGMAVEMEANAVDFYEGLAAKRTDEAGAQALRKLAEMERDHKSTFEAMRSELGAGGKGEVPRTEGGLFAAALADGYRVEGSHKVAAEMKGDEPLAEVLRLAIGLEKEAVLFYLGMKDVLSSPGDKEKVDRVIAEEKSHIVTLAGELKRAGR